MKALLKPLLLGSALTSLGLCCTISYASAILPLKSFDEQKFSKFLLTLINKSEDYLMKKNNLQKLNYQNTWNNVNQNLLEIFNEN